ncbi:MAG TPA: ABC transporter permease [Bryobacteraceae bacterium]|nr:ABC transporter permease [Bryobacteraceae bacterium]
MAWHHRFRNLFRRDALDRQLDDELAFHVAERIDELVEGGMSEWEARSRARQQFGSHLRQKEKTREVDMLGWLESIIQDLHYGIRTLAANRAFTATAVLSLALGVGANIAIFNIVNAVMLRSLPVEDPARLVWVDSHEVGRELTNPIWEYLRDHQHAFSGTLAYSRGRFDLAGGGESHFVQGLWVSGEFFKVLGVALLRGRVFTAHEDRRGTAPVAVISYRFWKRNFPDDSNVIGKTIRLDRHQFEIVGITPPWFTGLDVGTSYDVAIPIACEPILHTDRSALDNRSTWWLNILGRLAPGETERQAQSRLRVVAPALFQSTIPLNWRVDAQKDYLKSSFYLKPASTGLSEIRTQYGTALLTLMGAVGLVLLIGCANIANLLMARATARRRELSVRIAMGASRLRVIRQLLTESFLLSSFGTAIGSVFALWGGQVLVRLISATGQAVEINLSPDLRLLAFTIGTAVLTALLFGLLPALRATRGGLNQALKENERSSVLGSTRFNSGKALIAAQVALSLILLIGAGLFLGTLRNLLHVDLGFDSDNVLLVNADFHRKGAAHADL